MKLITIALITFSLLIKTNAGEPAYFLAGPMYVDFKQESFVVPITNEQHIAEAMAELEKPLTNRFAADCFIAVGQDYINRDYLNGKKAWNWHVVQFRRFAQSTIETYNWYPSYVEKDPGRYVTDFRTGGEIVFLGYPLIRRLSREEMFYSTAQRTSNAISLSWMDLGTNYSYTVQSRNLLTTNWSPLGGTQWPITATNVVITNSGFAEFYRVLGNPQN